MCAGCEENGRCAEPAFCGYWSTLENEKFGMFMYVASIFRLDYVEDMGGSSLQGSTYVQQESSKCAVGLENALDRPRLDARAPSLDVKTRTPSAQRPRDDESSQGLDGERVRGGDSPQPDELGRRCREENREQGMRYRTGLEGICDQPTQYSARTIARIETGGVRTALVHESLS